MTRSSRHSLLRWLAPLVAALVFAGGGAVVSAVTSAASAGLAPRSAAELLTDIQQARPGGLSGTVVLHADLGIPGLPTDASPVGGGTASVGSLLSGSHTLRVWYAGPERARLSLLGTFGESDLVRNGRSVWLWSSEDRLARHWTLPGRDASPAPEPPPGLGLTPQQAAEAALEAVSPTTRVTANGTARVAGRNAYLLTLAPRSADTLVDSVQVAIDGRTHVPTRVQLFAEGHQEPVFEVGFTSFDPGRPPSSVFSFDPPPGSKVTEESPGPLPSGARRHAPAHPAEHARAPRVVGSGWAQVLVLPPSEQTRRLVSGRAEGTGMLGGVLDKLPRVSGSWGSGRLLTGTVFSVLITDDGHVALGAVPPRELYHALSAPSAR